MNFPFHNAPNTATLTCVHVLDGEKPILYASHDEEDGMWQFLCGAAHDTEEARIVSLAFVFEHDNTIGLLSDMPCGYYAERKSQNEEWMIYPSND